MKIPNFQIENYIQKIAEEKIAGCLVYGPEESLVNYRFDIIAKKIVRDLSDPFLVTNLSKGRLMEDKAILADEFFSSPMLGGRKLIMIKDVDIVAGLALKLLFDEPDFFKKSENFILIQAGDLDKNSSLRKLAELNPHFVSLACYEDDDRVIKNFISVELTKRQIRRSPEVIELLADKFGKNRQIILSELDKLSLFLGEEKNLTLEIVDKLVNSESELSIHEFVMSFASQRFSLASIQAEKLFKDGVEAVTIIRFLSNYLQKVYMAKVEISLGGDFELAVKSQRLFFKVEAGFKKHLKELSLDFLVKKMRELEVLEIKIKGGVIAARALFLAFLMQSYVEPILN